MPRTTLPSSTSRFVGACIVAFAVAGTTGILSGCRGVAAAVPLKDRDLPWDELETNLSDDAVWIETIDNEMYVEECLPEYKSPKNLKTQENLVKKRDGLCMISLYCAFDWCIPQRDKETLTYQEISDEGKTQLQNYGWSVSMTYYNLPFPGLEEQVENYINDTSNPDYAMPTKVLFPKIEGDVFAIVDFAKAHRVELSVKASGHNYAGASTKKDTVLVNMSRFRKYSNTSTGIVDCDNVADGTFDSILTSDLSNQPCALVRERGFHGYVHVGGGENYGDVYQSVRDYNEAQLSGYKFMVLGGAAPTVTPMGWTWQGGLAATTGGRLFGLGADQVLQIEAVLPGGLHVRFGPTEWVPAAEEEFLYPTTRSVGGVCNANPYEEDESKWDWQPCDPNIDFDDLWFAFLGGGGGTFGIVTSVYIQLPDYLPLEAVTSSARFCIDINLREDIPLLKLLDDQMSNFLFDYFFDPVDALGVSEEDSNACARVSTDLSVYCYGEGKGVKFADRWKEYLLERKEDLVRELAYSADSIDAYADCLKIEDKGLFLFKDYLEAVENFVPNTKFAGPYFVTPYLKNTYSSNVLLPRDWMLQNKARAMEILRPYMFVSYFAFSENTSKAQNNAVTAVSDGYRRAGVMIFLDIGASEWNMLQEAYNFTDPDDIPSYIGSNHVQALERGPFKDDSTKQCDFGSTLQERDEQCVSAQAVVLGGKKLKRLEQIKEAIDPHYMLDCNLCVGNNRKKESAKKKEKSPKESKTKQKSSKEPKKARRSKKVPRIAKKE